MTGGVRHKAGGAVAKTAVGPAGMVGEKGCVFAIITPGSARWKCCRGTETFGIPLEHIGNAGIHRLRAHEITGSGISPESSVVQFRRFFVSMVFGDNERIAGSIGDAGHGFPWRIDRFGCGQPDAASAEMEDATPIQIAPGSGTPGIVRIETVVHIVQPTANRSVTRGSAFVLRVPRRKYFSAQLIRRAIVRREGCTGDPFDSVCRSTVRTMIGTVIVMDGKIIEIEQSLLFDVGKNGDHPCRPHSSRFVEITCSDLNARSTARKRLGYIVIIVKA